MAYCLVADINGQSEPVQNYHRKYDAIDVGLSLMANQCPYVARQRFNGISWFEIWTDEIQLINYIEAKYWYLLGYEHAETKQVSKAKAFGIKNSSLEYGCYDCGVRHSRWKSWLKRYF